MVAKLSKKTQEGLEKTARAPALNKREKEIRDDFVTQYLIDGDQLKAAIRIGYGSTFAAEYASKFIMEPYVQQQITLRRTESVRANGATLTPEELRDEQVANLRSIANDRNASAAARVSAIRGLSEMQAWNAPVKKELTGANGAPLGGPCLLQVVFNDSPEE